MFELTTLSVLVLILARAMVAFEVDDWKIESNTFELANAHRKGATLRFTINGAKVTKVTPTEQSTKDITVELDNHQTIHIQHFTYADHDTSEYEVVWKGAGPSLDHELCFHYGGSASWFGTYEEGPQHWPLDTNFQVEKGTPFITNDFFHNKIGGIVENLFINSDGFGIFLHHANPWFVRRDPNKGDPILCAAVSNEPPFPKLAKYDDPNYFDIRIYIKASKNIKTLAQATTNSKIGQEEARIPTPKSIPDERVLRFPIWSTWAEFKKDINEQKVMQYAHDIKSHGFPNSQVEIDDFWEHKYGDFTFDHAKFPDPKKMIDELHKEGFRVTAWVYPFVNTDSVAYQANTKHFLKNHQGEPQKVSWWDGTGGAVDYSDPEAAKWFVDRLLKLRNDTGLDSFKFDAGELNWYGKDFVTHDLHVQQYPNLLSTRYVETCAKLGTMIEVRTGYRSQHLPIFVRMLDKLSDWSINNGLKTLVTTSLMMSLAGYHFNLPDMIGGNAYGPKPDEELYIRWVQANAFLPSLQFSIPPWVYDQKTVNLTKKFVDLHAEHADLIIRLAHGTTEGVPIIRPMWWAEPDDARAIKCGDQYMLGDDIVVAPVLEKGHVERTVFLPSGTWTDTHGMSHTGPAEINVKAPLEELPYFKRKV